MFESVKEQLESLDLKDFTQQSCEYRQKITK